MQAQVNLEPRLSGRECGNNDHRRHVPRRLTVLVAALALLACWAGAPEARVFAAGNGTGQGVLPPSATPKGYSLADLSRLTALFTTSGNDATYYPNTPFQILYTNPSLTFGSLDCTTFAPLCGFTTTQSPGVAFSNTFTVKAGTMFHVPVFNADDSPPIVGVFPTTPTEAKHYVFDPAQLGARNMEIQIDSNTVNLGPDFVAGPVTTPPLLDPIPPDLPGGTHYLTIGGFLNPLTPGIHTIRIQGGYFGQGIKSTYGLDFLWENLTYSVEVKG
jgi:hypothetical protein